MTDGPRLVAVLTGSGGDQAVIATLARLARGAGTTVTLVRVVAPPDRQYFGTDAAGGRRGDRLPAVDQLERQTERRLIEFARRFTPVTATTAVLVGRDPAAEIVRWLAEHPADLLVVEWAAGPFRPPLFRRRVGTGVRRRALAPVLEVRHSTAPMIAPPVSASAGQTAPSR